MLLRNLFLWLSLCALLYHLQPNTPSSHQARQDILALIHNNRLAYQACMENLRHQSTSGYRAKDVFHAAASGGKWRVRQTQGLLRETKSPHDVAIDGEGFFLLSDASLTRDGSWMLRDGQFWLCSRPDLCVLGSNGKPLRLPEDMYDVEISADGSIRAIRMNGDGRPVLVGWIPLVRVPHPEWLDYQHPRLLATPASKPPFEAHVPGSFGLGVLAQGYLEMSNVDPVEQLETAMALRQFAGLLGDPSMAFSLPSSGAERVR